MTHVHPDVCRIWAGCETNRSGLLINWREELSFRSVYAARRSVQYQKGVTNTRAPSVDPLSPSVQQKWHTHTHKGTLLALESDSVGNRSLLHLYLRSETAFCGVIKKLLTFTGGGNQAGHHALRCFISCLFCF